MTNRLRSACTVAALFSIAAVGLGACAYPVYPARQAYPVYQQPYYQAQPTYRYGSGYGDRDRDHRRHDYDGRYDRDGRYDQRY